MKIRAKETFDQKFKNPPSQNSSYFGTVDFIKFKKNEVYQFYIVPKVTSIDLEKDEAEIDYPFEEVTTHFGTYEFMNNFAKMKSQRINCTGCAIDRWMTDTKLPKSVFKIAVGTRFFLAYIIHDRKFKVAWFQDYLYAILLSQIAKLMAEKELNLIDAFRHRVKLFTNSEGKFDIEIDRAVFIPHDSAGFKQILQSVNQKPLDVLIEQQIVTDNETIDSVLHALQDYTDQVIKSEGERARREKMDEKSKLLAVAIDAFKDDYQSGGNAPITDDPPRESVGPAAADEEPF